MGLSACSYPGGTQQFVHMRGYGTSQGIVIDKNASARMLLFAMASRDEKFAKCVKTGDVALAVKYVSPANVNKPIEGENPIFYATITGNTAMARMLISNGAKLKVRTHRGRLPAFMAAACGHPTLAHNLASEGGGSMNDIAEGKRRNAQIVQSRQESTARGLKLASAFAQVLLHSPGEGSTNEESDEKYARWQSWRGERDENNSAVLADESMPYSATGSDY